MHGHAFGGFKVRTGRDGACARIALKIVVPVLAAAVGLAGGSVPVHAGGPGGATGVGPVSFFDQWLAHDSELQLSQSGTGTLTLGDGATDTDRWSVTWQKNPSDSIAITLASLISRSGSGLGNVGDKYIATIQPDPSGFQLLYMHPVAAGQSRTFCTHSEISAPNAPAVCHI